MMLSKFNPSWVLTTLIAAFVSMSTYNYRLAYSAMTPTDLSNSLNALAAATFALKDLVLAINDSGNPAALPDVFDEFDDIFDSVLADIGLLPGTAVLVDVGNDQQLVFEAYSNFVQGLFELTDAISTSATTLVSLDSQNEFRVPCAIRELSGVVDAMFFNVIALFPSNTSFAFQTANQKNQVDTHFKQAIAAIHLATAQTPEPYSNTTDPVPVDLDDQDAPPATETAKMRRSFVRRAHY